MYVLSTRGQCVSQGGYGGGVGMPLGGALHSLHNATGEMEGMVLCWWAVRPRPTACDWSLNVSRTSGPRSKSPTCKKNFYWCGESSSALQFNSLVPQPSSVKASVCVEQCGTSWQRNVLFLLLFNFSDDSPGLWMLYFLLSLDTDCCSCVFSLQSKQLMERLKSVPSVKTSVRQLPTFHHVHL